MNEQDPPDEENGKRIMKGEGIVKLKPVKQRLLLGLWG